MYKEGEAGSWNSISVVEVTDKPGGGAVLAPGQFQYKLTRQKISNLANPKDDINVHISNMGTMIEEMEGRLRSTVDVVYFGKTQEVLSYLREHRGLSEAKAREEAQRKVISEMSKAAVS